MLRLARTGAMRGKRNISVQTHDPNEALISSLIAALQLSHSCQMLKQRNLPPNDGQIAELDAEPLHGFPRARHSEWPNVSQFKTVTLSAWALLASLAGLIAVGFQPVRFLRLNSIIEQVLGHPIGRFFNSNS